MGHINTAIILNGGSKTIEGFAETPIGLLDINGSTIFSKQINDLKAAGINTIIVSTCFNLKNSNHISRSLIHQI